jgi:hypothetical protein
MSCPVHGTGAEFWRRADGDLVCSFCHPDPSGPWPPKLAMTPHVWPSDRLEKAREWLAVARGEGSQPEHAEAKRSASVAAKPQSDNRTRKPRIAQSSQHSSAIRRRRIVIRRRQGAV